jgi:Family of unknown function (DUF5335)
MALSTQEIPRPEWKRYFDDFSRGLQTTVARIEVLGAGSGAQVEAERGILRGVSYDDRDDEIVVAIEAEGGAGDLERSISSPQKVFVGTEGATTVFDVEDAEGTKTLVSMEPAPSLPG